MSFKKCTKVVVAMWVLLSGATVFLAWSVVRRHPQMQHWCVSSPAWIFCDTTISNDSVFLHHKAQKILEGAAAAQLLINQSVEHARLMIASCLESDKKAGQEMLSQAAAAQIMINQGTLQAKNDQATYPAVVGSVTTLNAPPTLYDPDAALQKAADQTAGAQQQVKIHAYTVAQAASAHQIALDQAAAAQVVSEKATADHITALKALADQAQAQLILQNQAVAVAANQTLQMQAQTSLVHIAADEATLAHTAAVAARQSLMSAVAAVMPVADTIPGVTAPAAMMTAPLVVPLSVNPVPSNDTTSSASS